MSHLATGMGWNGGWCGDDVSSTIYVGVSWYNWVLSSLEGQVFIFSEIAIYIEYVFFFLPVSL
jgi:hypothetical protein